MSKNNSSLCNTTIGVLIKDDLDKREIATALIFLRKNNIQPQEILPALFSNIYFFSETDKAIISVAAKIASEPNDAAYHSNAHFLDVTAGSIMLGYHAHQNNLIDDHQYALLITAAFIHDYAHDGIGNAGEQFKLEQRAFEQSKDRLCVAGASNTDLAIIEAMILSTDVSRDYKDNTSRSPADTLKEYIVAPGPQLLKQNILHPRLKILHDLNITELAQMLQDADVGTVMCDPHYHDMLGLLVAREEGRVKPDANSYDRAGTLDFFIPKIMHGGQMFSMAGKDIIQAWIPEVMAYYTHKIKQQKKRELALK